MTVVVELVALQNYCVVQIFNITFSCFLAIAGLLLLLKKQLKFLTIMQSSNNANVL